MSRVFHALQRRFGESRPGLQLLAVEEAAIPVTVLRVDVLAQEKRQLPVTEEFVLRFVDSGIDTPASIAAYLGLEVGHVIEAAAAQLGENHLKRAGDDRLVLTVQGKEVVTNLVALRPVEQELPITFDRLTWAPSNYLSRALIEKKQAQEGGMTLLPAAKSASIGSEDVSPASLNSLLTDERVQVLRVHRVAVRMHRYLPTQLLVYGDAARNELELAVLIDDEISPAHELAFDQVGVVSQLGLSVGEAEPRPILDTHLEELRSAGHPPESLTVDAGPVQQAVDTAQVRSVSVFEHADILNEALDTAERRLLIVSPWVRGAVVNQEFERKLEGRLRAGVTVTIAHGIGEDDRGSDPWALQRLERLAKRYPKLSFERLRNTHAKILIYDDYWISTSFNWLSFRGDPNRTYRMEEGTLVAIPDRVDRQYEQYLQMVEDQRLE